MLISQTDIIKNDLSSCVLEALAGDTEQYKAIQEYEIVSCTLAVCVWCVYCVCV